MSIENQPNAAATSADFEFSALQEAYFYPRAIVREFSPFLSGRIIEVGAGIGQLTEVLAANSRATSVLAVEPDAQFANVFRSRCPGIPLVEGCVTSLNGDEAADAVVSVNVLEHIADDVQEMKRYFHLLNTRSGHLCILTPARPELYAPIDADFGHFRRYTKDSLRSALINSGFSVVDMFYFNFCGYFVWLVNFRLLRKRSFNPTMVRIYDRLVFRWFCHIERRLTRPPVGQSLIAIAKAGAR